VGGTLLKEQTSIQILRCLTLGRYTAAVEDGELCIRGPQPLAGALPANIRARRDELVDFLNRHAGGTWPPQRGSNLGGALVGTRIHIPTARRAGLVTYDYSGWPPGIVYIGRRFTRGGYNLPDSPWKNEHKFEGDDERERAVALYREDVLRSGELLSIAGGD
jgi:hypothetical protein